jgi:hypothetical protein
MYPTALTIHSILRLATTLIVLWAAVRALQGWIGGKQWTAGDRLAGLLALIVVDLQLVVGLLLHLVWSPVTKNGMADFGGAMKDAQLRHWLVEHPLMMLGGIALVHVGRKVAAAGKSDAAKHRRTLVFFALALALFVVGSPWPIGPHERPWVRIGG